MNKDKRIIIGIDPGSRCTGFGIIWSQGSEQGHITHGFIRCQENELHERLYKIHQQLTEVLSEFNPVEAAIEQVFTCRNPQSALKLGQARGAALVSLATHGLAVGEYSARQIKQAVVGYGAASKVQVQHMVKMLLKLDKSPQSDAADALAIALCHANTQRIQRTLAKASITAGASS